MSPSPPDRPISQTPIVNPSTGLAFWNVQLPPEMRTATCPPFLEYAFTDHSDRACLATPDRDHPRATWSDVQHLIRSNRLDGFRRLPGDLHRYRQFTAQLARDHDGVTAFILAERLRWADLTPRGARPFERAEDYKILLNDWPYAVDARIAHLVVWTKFELPPEPVTPENPTGDLTPEARRQIDDFVQRTFGRQCGGANVVWFKNWSALKSVHAVEHFHVMIFDPDRDFIREVTGGDVAMADKVRRVDEATMEGGSLVA